MSEMTISQALRRIKKLKGQLGEHLTRASVAVSHLADQAPAFSFGACLEAATDARTELLKLQTAVAVANARTGVPWGGTTITLAFAIRILAELKSEIAWTRELTVKAQDRVVESAWGYDGEKRTLVPTTWVCHLPEAKRAERVASLQDKFDKLNDLVETTNHKTLIEHVG